MRRECDFIYEDPNLRDYVEPLWYCRSGNWSVHWNIIIRDLVPLLAVIKRCNNRSRQMAGHECFFKIEKVIVTRIGSDFECSMQNEADALFSIQILSRVGSKCVLPLEWSELGSRIVFNLQQCLIVSDIQLYPVRDHSSIVKIYSFSRSHLDVKYFDMLPRQPDLGPQVLALNLSSEFQSDSYHNADSKAVRLALDLHSILISEICLAFSNRLLLSQETCCIEMLWPLPAHLSLLCLVQPLHFTFSLDTLKTLR